MRDKENRTIDYLRLSVTDLCDLRCQYCMPAGGIEKREHADILRVEELVKITEAAVSLGVRKVRITGGEPLVRRGILDLCGQIARIEGLSSLCMTTNGVRLAEMAGPLRDVGVDRLNISLDTMDPDRYRMLTRGGDVDVVWRGIEAAERAGFDRLKLNVVLLGGINDDEIASFVALTKERPWQVRFIELMPMGACAGWEAARFLPADAVLETVPTLQPEANEGVAAIYRAPGHAGTVGLIRPLTAHFCATCNRLRVTADGRLKPCLHSDQEIPLRGLHGDALREAFQTALAEKPLRHALDSATPSETHRKMHEIGG